MIRVIIYVLIVFALAAGFAWLADNPGAVTFTFQDFDVRTTVMAAAVFLVAILVVGRLLWLVIRALIRAPRSISRQVADRRRELGHNALTEGFIAIGAGDSSLASFYSAESRYYAQSDPLTLVLTAQTAQLSGDDMAARGAFEAMLAQPKTRILGLRGLFLEARRRGDREAARSFAEAADREKPGLGWAGSALLEYQAADGEWVAALATLENLTTSGSIDRARATRFQAVLKVARAMELEDSEPKVARDLALEAHRLDPGLVPAAVVASRLATRLGDAKRGSKVLEAVWRSEPHPEIAAAYMDNRPGESNRDRLRRMGQLTKIRANHREGRLAMARAAIDAQDWALAREELRGLIATDPTERAFHLMAEIEDGEHGDIGRARDWLSRAIRAPRDPSWVADGYVFDHWEPVSPVSGQLDAFEWRVPAERLLSADEELGKTAEAEQDFQPPAVVEENVIDAVAEMLEPNDAVDEPPTAGTGEDIVVHQPDDPGPDADDESDGTVKKTGASSASPPKRFKLFPD